MDGIILKVYEDGICQPIILKTWRQIIILHYVIHFGHNTAIDMINYLQMIELCI